MFTELKQTVRFMNSEDYKKRFIAEYWQLKILYNKLGQTLKNWNHLTFASKCLFNVLLSQYNSMALYLGILEERAAIENIDLNDTRRVQNARKNARD